MIAYNKTGLRNRTIVKTAKRWFAAGLMNEGQYATVALKYPYNFYNPNLFIKIGLFLFTCLAVGAGLGFYALLFMNTFHSEGFLTFTAFFFACAAWAMLELLIRSTRIHHSGTDEALLYSALTATALGIGSSLPGSLSDHRTALLFCLLMIPFLFAAVLRYAERLTALAYVLFVYAVCFLLVMESGSIAKFIMPFALMILSVPVYLFSRKAKKQDRYFFWKDCIAVFECVALLVFYLAGNYFAIRESGKAFFGMVLKPGQDVPLAFFFYAFTAIVPLLYVFFGLKWKDKLLLWCGLLLVAASVITFKHYFSLGHTEITLTVAGTIMILIAYAAIRYLKAPKYGITFEEDADAESFLKTNAEALLAAQSFAHQGHTATTTDSGPEFEGGSSGGGGAGGSF